jgi:hypothetical protein
MPPTLDVANATQWLADQIQDSVIQVLTGAWPKCPKHDHPLLPILREGDAVWFCPELKQVMYSIGTYEAPTEMRASVG